MNSQVPLVTVVIPAYNAAGHLSDALESIAAQTLKDVETIVVDDGSSDATVDIAKRFSNVMNLVVIRQSNAGPAAARNNGIRRARAPYCALLDADDVMLPERLEIQAAALQADSALGLVHTDLMTFNESGTLHTTRKAFSDPCGGMVLDKLLLDNFVTTSTVMAPKQRLVKAGLFGEARRISEDFELWLKMAEQWPIAYIDRPLVKYRRRRGSLSDNKLITARCALEVVESFWRDHPDYARRHPAVYRRSLAEHLATAGVAALNGGARGPAMSYLTRSLWLSPFRRRPWKSLAKAVLQPPLAATGQPAVGRSESA